MAQKPEWVLNLGTYSKKTKINRSQPGLDLARTVTDTLENKGVLGTMNCCDYFPTVPRVVAVDQSAPTEAEMALIPIGGLFATYEIATPTVWNVRVKVSASSSFTLGTNE